MFSLQEWKLKTDFKRGMIVTGLRGENKTSRHFRDYDVLDLLDQVDIILAEHGFARLGEDSFDVETRGMYRIYRGLKGETIVRFVTDNSRLIPYMIDNEEVARCPLYVERNGVPGSIEESIFDALKKI